MIRPSTLRDRKRRIRCSSLSASSSVLPISIWYPVSWALSSIPLMTSLKKGLERSALTTPIVLVLGLRMLDAMASGMYPSSSALQRMIWLVSWLMRPSLRRTLDTVLIEKPVASAMVFKVALMD